MFRLKTCALILTTSIAVSCRTTAPPDAGGPVPPNPIPATEKSGPADRGAAPPEGSAKTITFNIPSFDFTLLPLKFLQHLRETSPILDGPPPTYDKSRKNPAIIMSNGTYALMDKNSIINRKWTGTSTSTPRVLDVLRSEFRSYAESDAYVLGIDPATLHVTLPPETVTHEVPAGMTIRQQSFSRLTCVAHASLAAMEIRSDVPNDLSEQYAHHVFLQNLTTPSNCCDDGGVFVLDAAHDLENTGIPIEADFPYTDDLPACKGRSGFPCLDDHGHDATLPVPASRYRVTAIGEIPEGTSGATIRNVGYLESILASGFDIVIEVGIAWLNDKQPDSKGPDHIIPVLLAHDHNDLPLEPAGYHAMLLTGYDRNRHFFIARNSMGPDWGVHSGEAWLSYDYVTTYGIAGFIITGVQKEPQPAEQLTNEPAKPPQVPQHPPTGPLVHRLNAENAAAGAATPPRAVQHRRVRPSKHQQILKN
jgi:hypothetical protein